MFLLFYNLGIKIYAWLLQTAKLFNSKAALWISGRKGLFDKIEQQFSDNTDPIAWFHCASLGEFEQAKPVLEAFREHHKEFKILLTFFSPSGYEIRKNYQRADFIHYLPLDTPENAKKFIRFTRPSIAFFVKYEFWFHFLNELRKKEIPAVSFSAIFRPGQLFFRNYGKPYLELLKAFRYIFVQDESSANLLHKFGVQNVFVTGDTRFDRVSQICIERKAIPLVGAFKGYNKLAVIGSAWEEDIRIFLPELLAIEDLKIIIAPHELSESIFQSIEKSPAPVIRFSQANTTTVSGKRILLIDNIGMLSSLYFYADLACIGGAFGKGLHNILEAAVYGMPLFFGPNYLKFREARELIGIGSAFPVKDRNEFRKRINELINDPEASKLLSENTAEYVKDHTGATRKILKEVDKLIIT